MSPHPGWSLAASGLAAVSAVSPAAASTPDWRFLGEHALGAPANYWVTSSTETVAIAAVAAARAEIRRLDLIFNGRRGDSELAALNASQERTVSADLFRVLEAAEAARLTTGGAFNPGLGAVLRLWREAQDAPPARQAVEKLARLARTPLQLNSATRTVLRPAGVQLDLDAIAKGYIIDKALEAGLSIPGVKGMLVDIGGDMRGVGLSNSAREWPVGLPDPELPYLDAPLVAEVRLRDQAIATSGRGQRDRAIGSKTYSATLSPRTGWPTQTNIAATVTASSAIEADALATALLVCRPKEGLAIIKMVAGAEARIAGRDGALYMTDGWRSQAQELPPRLIHAAAAPPAANAWLPDWAVRIVYSAPKKDVAGRAADFREPYMAMWITDTANRPIRTLILVGKEEEWHRDNFVWWNMYKERAPRLVDLRSTATALSGNYPTFWPGYDDNFVFLSRGQYVLHIETSRERGQHTHRRIPFTIGAEAFRITVPPTAEGGGLTLVYEKRG